VTALGATILTDQGHLRALTVTHKGGTGRLVVTHVSPPRVLTAAINELCSK